MTGYYSNWNQLYTDARSRLYDKALDVWTWKIEDVSDADTPNINQLDIPIQANERVEIRIKSISEVGWPNAPIESDWCDVLAVDFPDDLTQVGNETSLILQEAQTEQVSTQIESKFNAKGLTTHLQQSYTVNDQYVAHTDTNLGTSFKDISGNIILLNAYLKTLTDRISSLEEIVSRAKGELIVKLLRNASEIKIDNGGTANVNVICEDYTYLFGGTTRTYYNFVYAADDYYLQFENISVSSQLGLLSYRKYVPNSYGDNRFYNLNYSNGSLACYVNAEDYLYAQQDNQFIWISDTSGSQAIYNSGVTFPSGLGKVLYSKLWNVGLSGRTSPDIYGSYTTIPVNIFSDLDWTGVTWVSDNDYQTDFPVTVHPYIENIQNYIYAEKDGVKLINGSTKFVLPIKIFFKLVAGNDNTVAFASNTSTSPYVTRKLRIFIEPESSSRAFEFEVVFKIFRNRTYNMRSSNTISTFGYPVVN
jgi:alpha-glucosidase (family GH31 glycosyl hydrolase)